MKEEFTCTVQKKSKVNAAAWILASSIMFALCLVVDLIMGDESPMKQFDPYFFILAVVLFIWWFIVNKRLKLKLTVYKHENGSFSIVVPLKDGTEIKADYITAMEPFFGRVFYGKGPKVKEIYLKLYNVQGKNTLTLFYSKGAIHGEPDGFQELEEMDLIIYDKGPAQYSCPAFQDIFYILSANKNIQVRYPVTNNQ